MFTARSSLRVAVAVAIVAVLGVSGALVVASSASAVPAPPSIDSPLDSTNGVFSTTVNPVDNGLEQTIRVYTRSDENVVVQHCEVVTIADPVACDVIIPVGEYGFYQLYGVATDINGPSAPSPNQSLRYGGAATDGSLVLSTPLNNPAVPNRIGSLEPNITGTAPALGTVEMLGYRSDLGVGTESSLCFTGVPATGAFQCPATFPSYGIWEVRVIAQDVEGGFDVEPAVESTLRLAIFPPSPTVSITPTSGEIGVETSGLAESDVGTLLELDYVVGETGVIQGGCPAGYDGSVEPTAGPVVTCSFLVGPGVHVARADQFVNSVSSDTREVAVYVPASPTLSVEPVPGGAVFVGTVDTLAGTLVASGTTLAALDIEVRDGAANTVCVASVTLSTGAWSCDGATATGIQSFTAVAAAQGFGDDPNVVGTFDGGYSNGFSDSSPAVGTTIQPGVTPPAPTMTYGLGPASIDVRAQGLEESAVGVRLYQIDDVPGEGYLYGEAVASCGVVIEGEGEGFGSIATAPSIIDDCLFSNLGPGIWNVYSSQTYYFQSSEFRDHYVLIPPAPSLTASPAGVGQVTASGSGEPGFRVLVRQLGGAGSCTAVVDTGGTWSCAVSNLSGDVLLRAQQQSQSFEASPPVYFGLVESYNGFSAFTPTVQVSAPAPLVPVAEPPLPVPWVLEGYDGEPLFPGQELSLSARGLPVGTEVIIEIRSTPQVLGSSLADDLGVFALDVTVPLDLEPGDHTLVALATPPGGVVSPIEIPVVVAAPAPPVEDGAVEEAEPTPTGASGDGAGRGTAVDRADPAAPSAISDSIPTLDRIFRTPLAVVAAGGLALAILLLVAFPSELLNSTLASNSRRIGRWYAAIDDRLERATEWFALVTRTRALAAALLVVLTAVIFGFVDPAYGFDPVSLRMTASLAIGLFIITYVASWISGAIITRVWGIPTRVGLQPAALLFAVIGVVAARLLDFSPGFLIGLVIGLDLLTKVGAPHRVRATMTSIGVMVGLSVLAWLGYSGLVAVSTGEPSMLSLLVTDTLVATAAEGLTATLAALMPLGFLQGHEIFRRSKPLWAGTFVAVAVLFSLIVLPTVEGEGEVADVGFWMLVMVVFAAVTLTLWALLHFTGNREGDDEPVEQPVGAAR